MDYLVSICKKKESFWYFYSTTSSMSLAANAFIYGHYLTAHILH